MPSETALAPVTRAELDAALPWVLSAPRTDAPIISLCTRPARNARAFPVQLHLTRAEGIPGDRWLTEPWERLPDGSPHPGIQVSILSSRVVDLVWRDREGTVHPGDPIVADLDTGFENLPVGSLIAAGSAVLKVSAVPNDGCAKWKARYGADAYAWVRDPVHHGKRLRGVLCSVEQDGVVTLADRLKVLRKG